MFLQEYWAGGARRHYGAAIATCARNVMLASFSGFYNYLIITYK
ncbi:hypothetical protein PT7_2979 [Pusillimonas sp. T7-7]|nr:hypothetical protein PT7_2979 [Pusillimonas sp. T7-7]